jgi:hypothetical protein
MSKPKKYVFNKENDEENVKKIVITSYEVTDGPKTMRFQGENVLADSLMNNEDWAILKKGVVKVAENGKVDEEAIKYLGTSVNPTEDNSNPTEDNSNPTEDNSSIGSVEQLAVENSKVTEQDVTDILNDVKALIKTKEGNEKGFDIESSENVKLKPIIEALELKIGEENTDPKLVIEKAISDLTKENLKPDQTATSIAAGLVTNATVVEEVAESTNDSDQTPKKNDITEIKDILNDTKVYATTESNIVNGKVIEPTDDISIKYIIPVLNAALDKDPKLNIDVLFDNAIAAVDKDDEATKKILDDEDASNDDPGDLNVNKALAFVKIEIAKSSSESSVNSQDEDEGDIDKGVMEPDVAKKPKVEKSDVEDILNAAKKNIEKDDKSTDKETYRIKDTYKDENVDLTLILQAVNGKIIGDTKTLDLNQLLDNAITASNGYTIPEDKTAAEIAADLIEKADDTKPAAGGSKHSKYVYGGKTVRAYPKNISFSKKNQAKKRQNKKTIRKLQKLMNKLK